MSLHCFATDVVPILQLAISVIGLLSLFLLWYQMKETARWNKVTAHQSLVSYLPDEQMERGVMNTLEAHKVLRDAVITRETAESLYADSNAFVTVKSYLNKFEHFCAAINSGAIDEDHAYKLHAGRVTYVQRIFNTFIEVTRQRREYPSAYIELERVAFRWSPRKEREKQAEAEENLRRRQRELERNGVARQIKQ